MWENATKVVEGGSWADVLACVEKSKDRLLNYEVTVNGKKVKRERTEVIFFIGELRCILTKKGFRFETPGQQDKTVHE